MRNGEKAAKDVDEYLNEQPADVKKTLQKVRRAIKTAAPKAEEVISYGIPTYKYKGPLVHFAAFKDHCSFVVVSKSAAEFFKEEFKNFKFSGRTVHFSHGHELPVDLIKRIVSVRLKENEQLATMKALMKSGKVKRK
jgi:uncharacterized protein YdhG (YjbR/CyaY superfamily)